MRRLIPLFVAAVIGCSDGRDPIEPIGEVTTYELTAIDGAPLPHEITIEAEPAVVTSGELLLVPGFISVSLVLGSPGSPTSSAIAIAGPYRRVTRDSLTFPVVPVPELFVRRNGETVTLVTQPSGGATGPAQVLGGAHRFTFVEVP